MANNKTNPAEVLGYFNDLKQAKRGAMMSSYDNYMKKGGAQQCGRPGKPKCKKKFGKRGGKLKKALGKVAGAAATVGAGVGGYKLYQKFKDNGGFN